MVNTYKDIVITPYRGDANNDPVIKLSAGDSTTNADMNIRFYATTNGTLSFEGSAGQLFSITNDLTNSIFSVNDVSGIPSIDVNANGLISFAPFGGNVAVKGNTFFVDTVNNRVGLGTTTPNTRLEVNGTTSFFGGSSAAPSLTLSTLANRVDLYSRAQGRWTWYGVSGTKDIFELACVSGTSTVLMDANAAFGWASAGAGSTIDAALYRDAANTIALRNGTAAQEFGIYGTYTDASNYEKLRLMYDGVVNMFAVAANRAGTGSNRDLGLWTAGREGWKINTTGHLLGMSDNKYDIGASGANRPRNVYVANNVNTGVAYQVNGKKAVNGPAFSAYADPGIAAQTITSGPQQKILFTLEEYDTDSCFANSAFTPTVEGYYQLNSTVRFDNGGTGTGELMIVIYKNGSEHKRGWNSTGTELASSGWFAMSVSSLVYANGTTDYFEIYLQQTSGTNRSLTRGSNLSWFNGAMVRGA